MREFSEEWVMMKVRQDLGYDTNNIYKDENDQRELNMMDEFKREEVINDRMNEAQIKVKIYESQCKVALGKRQHDD